MLRFIYTAYPFFLSGTNNPIMLSVVMLSVVMLSVAMLSDVAPLIFLMVRHLA
jgi:hypothetical protein